MYLSIEAIESQAEGDPPTALINLGEDDYADNPASTRRKIYGPKLVEYVFWPEGINASIVEDYS